MKAINTKRWLSVLLVLCMAASLFVTPALAVQVDTTPGGTDLEVEYFTSTLYNWDEDGANAATMEADKTAGGYSSVDVTYSSVAPQDKDNYTATSYFYKYNNEYYPVFYKRTTTGSWFWATTTYYLYYKIDNYYRVIDSSENGNARVTLYTSTASYEGKGFYFTNVETKPDNSVIPAFSSWTGNNQNYFIYSGLAEKYLDDATNAPFSNENVNAAKLFATDGSNEAYTDVYENVKVPFVYDETTGYYTLNSDLNAVYFKDGVPKDDATMAIADRPAVFYQYVKRTENTKYYGTGFQPFNRLKSHVLNQDVTMCAGTGTTRGYMTTPEIRADETDNEILDKHYGFGMVTEVPFQMTDSGTDAKGKDIVFTFSGDDDVWVYVDGVLALDIGGTHDAIFGEINFRTGEVTLTAPYYEEIGDKNAADNPNHSVDDRYTSEKLYQTNLYDALGTTLTGFAAQGQHTLTVYYMDRGRGSTNCVIQFNLPQRDSVSVTKEISPYYTNTTGSQVSIPDDVMETLNRIPFTFTIYKNNQPVSNASYSIMENGQFVDTASTDRNGTFTLLNGQTASFRNISLDERQSWYVVESDLSNRWTGSWSATSSVSGANINGGGGLTSGTVTVTGSATATDTISFVCTNAYAYQSELSVAVTDETSVLDYGLPVVVDVMANDLITRGDFESLTITNDDNLKYGTAVVDNGKIKYTLTQEFNGIETVEYQVTASDTNDPTIKKSDTGTLTIIPATSVYYEEKFGQMVTYKKSSEATWDPEGDSLNGYQESGLLTDPSCSTYGTDAFYLNQSGHSNGTTMHANAPAGNAAQFEYDFTGTGTTIYGMINATTGYICVEVTDTASNENVDYQYIDNVVLKNEHFDFIYNNPFYSITDLAYGKYHVVVYLYPAGTPTSAGTSGPDLYLDGIRVYNPMGTAEYPGDGYETAAFAYAQDGEANTVVVNIRAKLVNPIAGAGENPEGGFVTITDLNGNLTTVEDYARKGPNEELYLKGSNYMLSFAVQNWDSQSYKMYLGIKAPTGTSASVKIGSQTLTIENSTDCYYDISDYIQVKETDNGNFGYVYIEGVNGLVSLTNIKVTGDYEFELVPDKDTPGNPDGDAEGGVVETATRKLVMMSVADANALIGGNVDEPEEDQPVEEAPAFTPGSVKTSCVYSRLLRVATVTVTTSKDVDYVTINGRTVNGVTLFGSRYYTRAFTGISSGETLEIVCYNADGVASQVYTVVAK